MSFHTPTPRLSRLSRRQFIAAAGTAGAAGFAGIQLSRAADSGGSKVILGDGKHRYQWIPEWAKLPDGMSFGNTHGCIAIDSKKRVYMNTDSEDAIIVFDGNGKFLKAWGKDYKRGLHGMAIVKEGRNEVVYLAHTGRHEVVKTTLDGEVLMTLTYPEKAGVYKTRAEYLPTSVAVAPNGNIYIGDGYGKSWVHQYSADGDYVRSWGGRGKEPGQLHTPHGVWVDTRGKTPVVVVCDRSNARLQNFDLDGKLIDVVSGMLALPCHVHQRGEDLVVADLKGRITILDKENKLIAHLGENSDPKKRGQNKVPREDWRDGEFISPHCARWDDQGNLYVLDWNFQGRITKLKRI